MHICIYHKEVTHNTPIIGNNILQSKQKKKEKTNGTAWLRVSTNAAAFGYLCKQPMPTNGVCWVKNTRQNKGIHKKIPQNYAIFPERNFTPRDSPLSANKKTLDAKWAALVLSPKHRDRSFELLALGSAFQTFNATPKSSWVWKTPGPYGTPGRWYNSVN